VMVVSFVDSFAATCCHASTVIKGRARISALMANAGAGPSMLGAPWWINSMARATASPYSSEFQWLAIVSPKAAHSGRGSTIGTGVAGTGEACGRGVRVGAGVSVMTGGTGVTVGVGSTVARGATRPFDRK